MDDEAPADGPGVGAPAREEGGGDLTPGMGDAPCVMPGVDAGDLPMEELPCEAGTAAGFFPLSDEEPDFSVSASDSSSCGTFLAAEGRR